MHIVFGGIFNGKRDYVKQHFKPSCIVNSDLQQVHITQQTVSLEDFPKLIEPYVTLDEVRASEIVLEEIHRLARHNEIICVCDDLSRGVVPLEADLRKQRDILGRLYQQLFAEATSITRIWYGLPETIK